MSFLREFLITKNHQVGEVAKGAANQEGHEVLGIGHVFKICEGKGPDGPG